jgi:subfamily B ATP-binding cassette protein MsbA
MSMTAMTPQTPRASSWRLVARLYKTSLHRHLWLVGLSLLCMWLIATMASAYTYMMGPLVDKVFIAKDGALLWLLGGSVVGIFVVRSLSSYVQGVLLTALGQNIVLDTQKQLFGKLIRQDLGALDNKAAGTLVGSFTYDVNLLRTTVCNFFLRVGKDSLTVASLVGLMFYTDWKMALFSVAIAPLSIFPILYLCRKLRSVSIETQQEIGAMTSIVTQAFQAMATVRAYRMERALEKRVVDKADRAADLLIATTRIEAAVLPVFDGLGGLALAAMIVYGGAQVVGQAMTPGTFMIFAGAVYGAYQPLRSLARVNVDLQTGLAAAERVFGLMDRAPTVAVCDGAAELPRVSGAVRFEGVRFAYGEGEEAALRGADFTAPAGAVTALVGRTGAGKSTVLNLILRFYDPDEGRVVINGVDIREVSQASLRDNIAVVSQEVALFDDTAANNVRYGKPGATDEEVQAAIQAAGAADFLAALPQGLETRLGEGGVRLSGGQRQRIAIARAILKDAPILLLDEATSAQDPESERQIQKALKQLMWGRTTIVVAHRMATIRDAEVIHVLDNGRVVESGSHDELILEPNLYAHLHDLQAPPEALST